MGCIYKITNTINQKFYIGSSVNAMARKRTHFSKLRSNTHDNSHLQNSFNKYGQESFVFEIIESNISVDILGERELFYLQQLLPQYNKSTVCIHPNAGIPLSESHKKKISDAHKGKIDKRSAAQRQYAAEQSKLATSTEAFSQQMSISTKAFYGGLTKEEKLKRNAYKFGRVFSKETRQKLSEKASQRKWNEETKRKISETLKRKRNEQ